MLSLRQPCATASRPVSRRTVRVTAKAAGSTSSPFSGIMRIFTPDKYIDTKQDYTGTESGFKGDRLRSQRTRKPFKDGYSAGNGKQLERRTTIASSSATGTSAQAPSGSFMDYLAQAAQRVVGNNFTGDDTEPDWAKIGQRGWSGDVRRNRRKI